jgi:hypothetical protein
MINTISQECVMLIKRSSLPRAVEFEIRSANRGRMPATRQHIESAAARFGCRVVYHPAPFRPENSVLMDGEIHVPMIDPNKPLHACYLHELAEACMRWEGRAPIIAPEPTSPAKHEVARAVDLSEPRKCLTQDLNRRIARQAAALAASIEAAGYDHARVCVTAPGKSRVTLHYNQEPEPLAGG